VDIENPNFDVEEKGLQDEFTEMTSLTYTQRITGFFLALAAGVAFLVIAMTFLPMIVVFSKKFAFFFTMGNLFCLGSTVFLVGLRQQLSMMMDAHRAQVATLYVVSVLLTLLASLHWQSSVLAIVFSSVQLSALVWYCLSFVPFARHAVYVAWHYVSYVVVPLGSLCCSGVLQCLKAMKSFCGS
jgi:hypothetical protein